jgi:hypothetical protein
MPSSVLGVHSTASVSEVLPYFMVLPSSTCQSTSMWLTTAHSSGIIGVFLSDSDTLGLRWYSIIGLPSSRQVPSCASLCMDCETRLGIDSYMILSPHTSNRRARFTDFVAEYFVVMA